MKKLNLTAFDKGEILTRAQLKKVVGGYVGDTACATTCKCPAGWLPRSGVGPYSVSVNPCSGNCIAVNEVSVTCGTQQEKCETYKINYCYQQIV